jgi:hypothetical protein
LAFQVAAGPEIEELKIPITTATGGGTPTGGSTRNVGLSLSTNLEYQLRRTGFTFAYIHGLSGGSGVQAGSESDTVNGSVNRQVSRNLTAGITGGYSRSSGLTVDPLTTPTTSFDQTLDYWYGGGNLGYALSRTLTLSLTYRLQYQNSGTAFCVSTTCGTSVVRHTISFGVNWRDRPLLF